MRKILIAGLVVLNIVLAFGVFATPAETRTAAAGPWPCCKGEGPDAFCTGEELIGKASEV